MNIVLLSGGSGERLWPLSNEIRSKQFIKLFKNPSGQYESMVQRVYRQIRLADENAKITIATSKSQVSALKNQLGNDVSICVEPCRRDTFPAIVLACLYLKEKLSVNINEPVIICPVDPFVDSSYFEAVKSLEKIVKEGTSALSLLGIEPTYPSEKYGYIMPLSKDKISPVSEFKEKPDRETAKKYIEKGAVWNAGVFAFKLSYVLEKAHSMIDFEDYDDFFQKYHSLTKISFDYAVSEKESSIQVVRFNGEWKDVGTWNMMSEVMADSIKGNAIYDEESKDVNIINELDIPILVMGAKNMVVAASNDGILVSDKERSGYMKPFVEKIKTDAHFAEKSWGTYKVIDVTETSLTAKIYMKANAHMSYHSHEIRNEIWTVLSGKGTIILDGSAKKIEAGDSVEIKKGTKHSVIAETSLVLLETQIGSEIAESDKIKYDYDFE